MNGHGLTKGLWCGLVSLALCGFCATGCTINVHGKSAAGFEQQSRWGVYSEAETDETGKPDASATLSVQAILDYLRKQENGPDAE